MKIALICGGPSPERGISLNSARSVMDHLSSNKIEIIPFYLDLHRRPYKISTAQLYSNTPSDFDFKLSQTATPLNQAAFIRELKKTSIVFPAIHGTYGEDGGLQRFLERHNIPYIGSNATACANIFDKFRAHKIIHDLGFFTMPTLLLKIFHNDHSKLLTHFFKKHHLKRVIVKPASGGSSIGVFSVENIKNALEKTALIFSKRLDTRVVVEPFAKGQEFTVIILQNNFGLTVALVPTEIETDYTNHQIFDYRKKYLPTRQVTYHCPPRFDNATMQKIQVQAEQIFTATGLRDFARFDGWVLPNGEIWFSDLNPISGMEQNSFLFQQAARVGLTHSETLNYVLRRACRRYGLELPRYHSESRLNQNDKNKNRRPVAVLFGGATSERQVSVMSGTNVWLKLRRSEECQPTPYLLTQKNEARPRTVARAKAKDSGAWVWKVPYPLALYHTAEEIAQNCAEFKQHEARLSTLTREVRLRLGLPEKIDNPAFFAPTKMTLRNFIRRFPFVFNALHGGTGENGTLQGQLTNAHVKFNGSEKKISALCMDKWATKEAIKKLKIPGVHTIPGAIVVISNPRRRGEKSLSQSTNGQRSLLRRRDDKLSEASLGMTVERLWKKLRRELGAHTLIAKPRADGCSSGVVHLHSSEELRHYVELLQSQAACVPPNTFKDQNAAIDLPTQKTSEILLEKTVETDKLRVVGNRLKYSRVSGWIEITVGVVEQKKKLHAFNPSVTVAERSVLSVEEKFQGGTGINITPPPASIVSPHAVERAKKLVTAVATELNIQGYARLDAFMHVKTGDVMIIEINTLPALTPSTVLYQQALAEKTPIFPRELLEELIFNKGY